MNKLLLNSINKKRLSIIDSLSSFLKNEICYYAMPITTIAPITIKMVLIYIHPLHDVVGII